MLKQKSIAVLLIKSLRQNHSLSNEEIREFISKAPDILFKRSDSSRMSFLVLSNSEFRLKMEIVISSMLEAGIPKEVIEAHLPLMTVTLNEEVGEYVKKLLDERGEDYNEVEKNCGLSRSYLHQIIKGKSALSKEYLFALSLYLGLSRDEVDEFMKIRGVSFETSIADETFLMFLESGNTSISDYVRVCRKTANACGAKLSEFFSKNKNYSD